jgi:lysophospholipase L1-like esterase
MANSMQGGFLRDDTGALVLSAGSGSGSVAPGLTLAGLGDSKTANGSVSTTNAATSAQTLLFGALDVRNWHLWACLLSNGALTYAGMAATGGFTSLQVIDTHLQTIIAAKPAMCVVECGTNDVPLGGTTTRTNLLTIWKALAAAGIVPVLCTLTPRNDFASGGTIGPLLQLNLWIQRQARLNGWPCVDLYNACAATGPGASGGWAAGLNGDNVHPNGKGAKAMGQAVATALQTWTTPGPPFLPTVPADTASGRYNGLGNPLFTDTNADGTPDGWTLSGAPTAASAADAAVVGNAFSITRTAADGFASGPNTIPTSQGDVLQVSTRIKSTVEASGGNIYFAVIDASSEAALGFQLQGWNVDIPWSTLSVAFKAPAMGAATAMKMKNSARGVAGAQLQIAQVALVNLTTAGLA